MGAAIVQIASAVDDPEAFTARARGAAEALGPRAIRASKAYLYSPPPKPPELAGRHEAVGDWMEICQAAIFEMWFYFGADALRDLREVAFGVYDWTQAHATRVVCRLAQQGVDREGAAELIAEALPEWRYEQVMRVCGNVAALAPRAPTLRKAYDRLVDDYLTGGDPIDAYELIAADARADPAHARERYLPFLRELMAGKALAGRTAFDDGHVVATEDGRGAVAKSGPEYPQIADYHQMRAAVLLRELLPGDASATARLAAWAAGHPDENVRHELREILGAGAAPG